MLWSTQIRYPYDPLHSDRKRAPASKLFKTFLLKLTKEWQRRNYLSISKIIEQFSLISNLLVQKCSDSELKQYSQIIFYIIITYYRDLQ